ncbi:MAG: NAD(P)-dependent oxidoreductase [Acidobacteriota bacterium]
MKETILVTGGAGYIGSWVVRQILQDGRRVLVVDNLSFGGESLVDVWTHPDFDFINADITSLRDMKSIFSEHQISAVIHLAAVVGDPACARQPDLAERVNKTASEQLLDLSQRHRVERFIFASTCSNYGRMEDPDGFVDETSPLAPISLYAEQKVGFEKLLLNEIQKKESFSPTCLRFSTAYGVSPRMRFDLTLNEFTKELSLGRALDIFGEQFWRPYCHAHDLARAVLTVLQSPPEKVAFNVFNVGDSSENYQKKTLVQEISKVIPESDVKYFQKDEDPRDYRVSFEKIKREIGFVIKSTVREGIREIHALIQSGIITDPDSSRYKNC